MLSIRYATREDAPLIADISHQTFYDTFAANNRPEDMQKFLTQQFTKGRLMMEVGAPENTFLLAYYNNEIAGYVKLRDAKKPVDLLNVSALEIARLYATNQMIGKGIGKALMQISIDIAKERKKQVLWLGVWEKNQRAIDFYTKWGFEKFSECDFTLGDDVQRDWMMKKTIS
jgi:ribosomal protein S18 acetylase RimI-like enzyme